MSIQHHHCYLVSCDECRAVFDENVEYIVHFESEDDAIGYLAESGWAITEAGVITCPRCSVTQLCNSLGHLWGPWIPCQCKGRIDEHAVHGCTLTSQCTQCGHATENTFADLPTIDEPTTFGR